MSHPFAGRRPVVIASLLIVGAIGCSQFRPSTGGATSSSKDAALIGVDISQLFVTIENKAGLPLFDVRVAIVPVGRQTLFTNWSGRIENGDRREFGLGSFSGRDGTPFNLRVVKPKAVTVTAKDMNDRTYDVEVPWP